MKKTVFLLAVIALLAAGTVVPLKKVETGGSCPGIVFKQRHNLILGDTLPQAGNHPINGEGCSPLTKHSLYLL